MIEKKDTGTAGYTALLQYIKTSEHARRTKKFILRSPPSFGTNLGLAEKGFKSQTTSGPNKEIIRMRDGMKALVSRADIAGSTLQYVDGTSYGLDPHNKHRTQCPLYTASLEDCQVSVKAPAT